ncbi:MAG: pre-16S rRNA-processing nuclease YqgF [Armatimonadota bacterium]|nr:MAG: pre-16S rRNA-processing nuclease YqgF [Armatimonadota bacterium]
MGQSPRAILAVDPGRDKCGIAVVSFTGDALAREVVSAEQLAARAQELARAYDITVIVVGDRTGADAALHALEAALPQVEATAVDEHRSTEEARRLYFREHPPRGWRRLMPRGLQTPPHPYDDYVAVVLAQRFLRGRGEQAG